MAGDEKSVKSWGEDSADSQDLVHEGCRGSLKSFIVDARFEMFMGFVVLINIAVIVRETDMNVSPECTPEVQDKRGACTGPEIAWVNFALLLIYTWEVSTRLYIYLRNFFLGGWNVLDLFIIISGWVDLVASGLSDFLGARLQKTSMLKILKIFRLFRLVRLIRLLRTFPQLYRMVQGFASALRAMFWGIVMIFMMLCLFSLIVVQMVSFAGIDLHQRDPHTDDRLLDDYCVDAMQNVFKCGLMFFQTLMAGDSWGFCAIPLIKMKWWMLVLLGSALVFVQLGFTNLVLAVIVESANESADSDEGLVLARRQKEEQKRSERIAKLLRMLDKDRDGLLTQEEIMRSFEESAEVRYGFQLLEIDEEYMLSLLRLIAEDREVVEVEELVTVLKKRGRDVRTRLTLLELQINEVTRLTKQLLAPVHDVRSPHGTRAKAPAWLPPAKWEDNASAPPAKWEDTANAPLLRGIGHSTCAVPRCFACRLCEISVLLLAVSRWSVRAGGRCGGLPGRQVE